MTSKLGHQVSHGGTSGGEQALQRAEAEAKGA